MSLRPLALAATIAAAALSTIALSGCTSELSAEDTTAVGSFAGVGGHAASGEVRLMRAQVGWVVAFGPDFAVDAVRESRVGFGNSGIYVPSADLGPLQTVRGSQTYPVPPSIDPDAYSQIQVIALGTPIAVANLVPMERGSGTGVPPAGGS